MNLIKHIQFQQLINLLLLILVGFLNTTLQTNILAVVALMLFSGALELGIKQELYVPYSAFITALGVVLMVGWLKWYIPYIIIALAIAQKHYLKLNGKHIFNPSNFALIVAIALFYPKALPIVGELGKQSYIIYVVIAIGTLILIRVNRYIITLSFLLFYITLSYFVIGKRDPTWSFEHFVSMLYSTSFIVYIFFMLTDPITTPKKSLHQVYFGAFIATLSILLDYFVGVRLWHQFIALFLASILFTPIDKNFTKKDYIKLIFTLLLATILVYIITVHPPIYFSM